jgi:hypothetical protein
LLMTTRSRIASNKETTMFHRTLLTGLLALGTIVCMAQTTPAPSPEIKAFLERVNVFDRPNYNMYYSLTAEERRLLIAHFQEQKRRAEEPQDPITSDPPMVDRAIREANRALLLLNDPETIDPIVRRFTEAPLKGQEPEETVSNLWLVSDPKVVERLAPEMEKDEPFTRAPMQGDVGGYDVPKPYYAAHLMLKIVANSPEFEGNTRKWASDNLMLPLAGDASEDHARGQPMVRQWWKENAGFFKAGDYKSVKPGEQVSEVIGQKARAVNEWVAARDAKVAAENAAREAAASSSTATRAVSATGWGAFGYGIVGLLILLLVAAVLLYSRSARHV